MTKPIESCGGIASRLAVTLLSLSILLPAAVAFGQEASIGTTIDDYSVSELGVESDPEGLELALEDVIAYALEHNLSLAIERYQRSRSILAIAQNMGIYDFTLGGFFQTRETTSQPVTDLVQTDGAEKQEVQVANVDLSRLTPIGGTATLSYDNTRFETNDAFFLLNPNFDVDLSLQYVQPLLRNFGRVATERNLIIAKVNAAVSRESFELQVAEVIQQVSDRYWDLVESREQLKVSRESLELAEELHEMNRIQVEVGTKAPLEMVQSEAGVASRREEIIRGRAAVEDNEDLLRQLVNLEQGPLWEVSIVPVTDPEVPYREIDLREAIEVALEERPEVRTKRLQNRNLEVDARFFKNQKKPRLDLTAIYGQNGVGGDVRDRNVLDPDGNPVIVAPGGYSDALDQLWTGDSFNWTLQLVLSYPLQNRTAKAQSAIADLALDQGVLELQELEKQIFTEVRRAERAVRTAAERIESAKVASRLAQKNLDAEQKRYENGLSTSFEVLQIQEDLAQARSSEVSAVIAYRKALTAFYRAIGELLDETGVELVAHDTDEDYAAY